MQRTVSLKKILLLSSCVQKRKNCVCTDTKGQLISEQIYAGTDNAKIDHALTFGMPKKVFS